MNDLIDNILVIKVGTSTLTKIQENGQVALDVESFQRIGRQIIELRQKGYHVVVVSSAAITAGMVDVGLSVRPNARDAMPNLQRLASIGWRHILNAWSDAIEDVSIGELLLTKRELESRIEEAEALRVSYELMTHGNVPIINENDAITHEEIAFGDNDTLAAIFTGKIKESKLFGDNVSLIILSDIDGVYADVSHKDSVVKQIDNIDHYKNSAQNSSGPLGTGGMITKFAAAKIVHQHGVDMYIANGRMEKVVQLALDNKTGTHFKA
jgi:glutamate 5-kinase